MSKRKIIFAAVVCVMAAVVSNSCTKDIGKLPVANVSACDTVTYTKHIKPLLDENCLRCHGDSPTAGAPQLTTYDQLKQYALNGQLQADIVNGTMPQDTGVLPQDQQNLIICWITNGQKQ